MTKGNREEEILKAAITIFSEKGYSAATTSEIAKAAGVADGTIFRYFKTKKDILIRVMAKLIETLGDKLITARIGKLLEENKGKNEREVLKAILKDRMDLISENWDMIKIILTEAQFHPDIQMIFIQNIILKGKTIMERLMEEGKERGFFREFNLSVAIRSFVGMTAAYALQKNFLPDLIEGDEEQQLEEMLDIFLYGIAKRQD